MKDKMVMFVDARPNMMGEKDREQMAKLYCAQYEKNMEKILDRLAELPAIMIKAGPHLELLKEARVLYMHAYYYSCVAMCGITAERILKDVFVNNVFILDDKYAKRPPKKARDSLENFNAKIVAEFLLHGEVLDKSLREPFKKLGELRNKYAHGTGLDPEKDAKAAIDYLHKIVEGTVSLFEKYGFKKQPVK